MQNQIINHMTKSYCGPHILAHALPLNGEFTFYLKNDLPFRK